VEGVAFAGLVVAEANPAGAEDGRFGIAHNGIFDHPGEVGEGAIVRRKQGDPIPGEVRGEGVPLLNGGAIGRRGHLVEAFGEALEELCGG
jgi:hypothetical protein